MILASYFLLKSTAYHFACVGVISVNFKAYVDVHPSPGKHRVLFVCELGSVG